MVLGFSGESETTSDEEQVHSDSEGVHIAAHKRPKVLAAPSVRRLSFEHQVCYTLTSHPFFVDVMKFSMLSPLLFYFYTNF